MPAHRDRRLRDDDTDDMLPHRKTAEPGAELFRVSVLVSGMGTGGTIAVSRGEIVVETWRLMRFGAPSRIIHTDPDVVVVTVRLLPPWCSTSMWLHDDQTWLQVRTRFGARKRLVVSLRKSRFRVREATAWLSSGSSHGVVGF